MIKLSTIKPNPNNPRIIRNEKFEKLKRSIEEFPEMIELRPIVIDETNTIIGGNMRFRALQELGKKEVPNNWIKKASELTEDQKKRFVITDNASFGEWEWETIKSDWDLNFVADWGVDIPEFGSKKIKTKEGDFNIDNDVETDIKEGDLFKVGNHYLLCGDSTNSELTSKLMGGTIADMVFTDPDFSMTIDLLFAAYANSKIHSKGFGFWIAGDKQAVQLAMNDFGNFAHFFVQDFRNATIISNTQAMSRHTLICKFGNIKMTNLMDGFSTLIQIATMRTTKEHRKFPMAKRIELPSEFIQHYTNPGDSILDLFGHSGSTMLACDQLGRICYTQELNPKYCQLMIDRMKQADENILVEKIA